MTLPRGAEMDCAAAAAQDPDPRAGRTWGSAGLAVLKQPSARPENGDLEQKRQPAGCGAG